MAVYSFRFRARGEKATSPKRALNVFDCRYFVRERYPPSNHTPFFEFELIINRKFVEEKKQNQKIPNKFPLERSKQREFGTRAPNSDLFAGKEQRKCGRNAL